MALRKKKPQQDDSEKLQALLKSWDIQFPETSEKDFPKTDFPEMKSDAPKSQINLKKEIKPKINLQKNPEPEFKFEQETPPKKSVNFEALFGKSKKAEPPTLLTGNADLDKMFKQQVIQYLHGTVKMITPANLSIFLILIFWGTAFMNGIKAILSIFLFLGAALWIWYMFSWKLTFNGETNRFSYSSLFHQEIHFHVSEIQSCKIERKITRLMTETLYLKIYNQTIIVNLGYMRKKNMKFEKIGGYHNSDKLKEYLELYQELHGNFSYSGFLPEEKPSDSSSQQEFIEAFTQFHKPKEKASDSSSKQELMDMLAQYQKQIDEKKNLNKE